MTSRTTRVHLVAVALFTWLTLGCSGLVKPLAGYGTELGDAAVSSGIPYEVTVTSPGTPIDLWLKYSIAASGTEFTIRGPVKVLVDGKPVLKDRITVDEEGVHYGDYRRAEPLDRNGKGIAWATKKIATLDAYPKGSKVTVRGKFGTPAPVVLKEGRVILTE